MSIKKLRYLRDHKDVYQPSDHNDQVDNWKVQININDDLKYDDPTLEDLIAKLKTVVARMKYLKKGDWYFAEYHNPFVDAWQLQEQINELLYYWKQQATKSIAQVKVTFHGRVWNYVHARVLAPDPAQNTLRLIPFAKHSISASAILMQTLLLKASASISASAYVSQLSKIRVGGMTHASVSVQAIPKKASILISANVTYNVVK